MGNFLLYFLIRPIIVSTGLYLVFSSFLWEKSVKKQNKRVEHVCREVISNFVVFSSHYTPTVGREGPLIFLRSRRTTPLGRQPTPAHRRSAVVKLLGYVPDAGSGATACRRCGSAIRRRQRRRVTIGTARGGDAAVC